MVECRPRPARGQVLISCPSQKICARMSVTRASTRLPMCTHGTL